MMIIIIIPRFYRLLRVKDLPTDYCPHSHISEESSERLSGQFRDEAVQRFNPLPLLVLDQNYRYRSLVTQNPQDDELTPILPAEGLTRAACEVVVSVWNS